MLSKEGEAPSRSTPPRLPPGIEGHWSTAGLATLIPDAAPLATFRKFEVKGTQDRILTTIHGQHAHGFLPIGFGLSKGRHLNLVFFGTRKIMSANHRKSHETPNSMHLSYAENSIEKNSSTSAVFFLKIHISQLSHLGAIVVKASTKTSNFAALVSIPEIPHPLRSWVPTKRSSGQKGHWKMNGCKTDESMSTGSSGKN